MSVEVHVLASGSDGNCTVVTYEDHALMIDAGLSFKRISKLMDINGVDASSLDGILITHEHSDHVAGAGATSRKLNIPIICNKRTFDASPFGKVEYEQIRMDHLFSKAGMDIIALPTSHNAVEPCSYLLRAGDKKVLIATDTGKLTFPVEHALGEADIALVESNYDKRMLDDGPYPYPLKRLIDSDEGHMCNVMTGMAIRRTMGPNPKRQIFLAHLSKTNNTPDTAKDTISEITGIRRMKLDCLDYSASKDDTRILRA